VVRRLLLVLALLAAVSAPRPAAAQDPGSTTSITAGAPTQDIVPEPNSGEAPSEAGDRGGALQLGLLALVLLVIAGAVGLLVRQSRRARGLA
jgi:uncharacterized protein HemX